MTEDSRLTQRRERLNNAAPFLGRSLMGAALFITTLFIPALFGAMIVMPLHASTLSLARPSATASANNRLQVDTGEPLRHVGEGRLRKFGFHVYDASTWATHSPLPPDGRVQGPFVLQLVYARDIDAADLVDATRDAWSTLGLLDTDAERWLLTLASLWPDVSAGDCLALQLESNGVSRFWFNGKPLGAIADVTFGPRFAAIWLHPDSPEPSLRAKLLGGRAP